MQAKLVEWYKKNKRELSFRESRDPYKIWISEVMLQQTQVATMLPYFDKFIQVYPNPTKLAEATLEEVLYHVQGLGYYRRFRFMHQAAKVISETYGGHFPKTYKDVLSLPGVGRYTAGAIMSIAYDEPYSAVDGNVIRVLSRFSMTDGDMRKPSQVNKIESLNTGLIEKTEPHYYTQALMELGATVCKVTNPLCVTCPLKDLCKANLEGVQTSYPQFSSLKEKVTHHYVTFVLKNKAGDYILRKRSESLLEGFYEYPQVLSESLNYALDFFVDHHIKLANVVQRKQVKHVFTHQIWEMDVYEGIVTEGMMDDWHVIKHHEEVPMATAHKKIGL